MDIETVRRRYPICGSGVFLNHAATAPVSHATIARMEALCREMQEPLGKHFYQWLGILEETRRLIAELIHAHPSEIALTSNTSTSLSIIAGALSFEPGDRVLVPRDEFPSNRYVWQNLRDFGVECHFFDIPHNHSLVEVLEAHDLSGVRLISVSQVSYLTGKKHDIKAFAAFCRRHGIISCVDAIQAVGTIPVDVHDAGIDFLAAAGQKWLLGPVGCGYLYVRKGLLDKIRVPLVGWTSVRYPENFSLIDLDFAPEATRFEPGLQNAISVGGLNQSLRELGEFGWQAIFRRIEANTRYLVEGLSEIDGVELMVKDPQELGAIVSFYLPETINPKKLLPRLAEKGITVTARDHYVRVSPHFYNTQNDLDRFIQVMGGEVGNRRLFFPEVKKSSREKETWMLLNGATGTLGREIALYLAEKGYHITGLGRDKDELEKVREQIHRDFGTRFESIAVDFRSGEEVLGLVHRTYLGLINCAGIVEADLTATLDPEKLEEMMQVNVLAPTKLMQQFVARLRSDDAIGILNIVSPSGRCGYPLLGGYGAANAALWTIGESMNRELCKEGLHVTTYVASALHSPMQKHIGRSALRYFKMGGAFDYQHAEEVARQAVDAFFGRKSVVISWRNRLRMVLNTLFPQLITRRISKAWRPEEVS